MREDNSRCLPPASVPAGCSCPYEPPTPPHPAPPTPAPPHPAHGAGFRAAPHPLEELGVGELPVAVVVERLEDVDHLPSEREGGGGGEALLHNMGGSTLFQNRPINVSAAAAQLFLTPDTGARQGVKNSV
jgi:hypothetical protein